MNTKQLKLLALPVLVASLSACAVTQPAWETTELGGAVASMVENQIADPAAAANPQEGVVESADGSKTAAVIDAYRKSLAAPKESTGDIVINVGK